MSVEAPSRPDKIDMQSKPIKTEREKREEIMAKKRLSPEYWDKRLAKEGMPKEPSKEPMVEYLESSSVNSAISRYVHDRALDERKDYASEHSHFANMIAKKYRISPDDALSMIESAFDHLN